MCGILKLLVVRDVLCADFISRKTACVEMSSCECCTWTELVIILLHKSVDMYRFAHDLIFLSCL